MEARKDADDGTSHLLAMTMGPVMIAAGAMQFVSKRPSKPML